jgi:hypothetical protein
MKRDGAEDTSVRSSFWSFPTDELLFKLNSKTIGLTSQESLIRLKASKGSRLDSKKSQSTMVLLASIFLLQNLQNASSTSESKNPN